MNIFGGSPILWIFLGHHKFGLYLGVISMHLRVIEVSVKKGFFFGC